jgi:hypothetical protein
MRLYVNTRLDASKAVEAFKKYYVFERVNELIDDFSSVVPSVVPAINEQKVKELACSLNKLAEADAALFDKRWRDDDVCRMCHEVATRFGKKTYVYDETADEVLPEWSVVEKTTNVNSFYLSTPKAIASYMTAFFRKLGMFAKYNKSFESDSCYVYAQLNNKGHSGGVNIRISNHDPQVSETSKFDYDCWGSYRRKEGCSYVKAIEDVCKEFEISLPKEIQMLLDRPYKDYILAMGERTSLWNRNCLDTTKERLYV